MRMYRVLLVAVLLVSAAQAQKIKVEYDKNVDFSQFKTFAWDEFAHETNKPGLKIAIMAAVEHDLTARGLTKVDTNPDLRIAGYGAVDSDAAVTYSDMYYGYGGIPPFDQSFLMWGAVPGSVTTVVVHKGQLIIVVQRRCVEPDQDAGRHTWSLVPGKRDRPQPIGAGKEDPLGGPSAGDLCGKRNMPGAV